MIDKKDLKPGDKVRLRIEPSEPLTVRQGEHGELYVGNILLDHGSTMTILEHIPARPDWAEAKVVRDRHGDLWGPSGSSWRELTTDPGALILTADFVERKYAPITVVLDADGNPPGSEPEWLDAEALDELPPGSIVIHRHWPRYKRPSGEWRLASTGLEGRATSEIAPARLLWRPEP